MYILEILLIKKNFSRQATYQKNGHSTKKVGCLDILMDSATLISYI